MKKTFYDPVWGTVEMCSRSNSRLIYYDVRIDKLRIVSPQSVLNRLWPLTKEIEQNLLAKRAELKKKVTSQGNAPLKAAFTPTTQIQTLTFQMQFAIDERLHNSFTARIEKQILTVYYAPDVDFDNPDTQRVFKRVLTHFLKIEAKRYLPTRLRKFAAEHQFSVKDVKISSAVQRWGSCNANKVINLSCYLMMLPSELIDLVLLHELCHTVEMNHSDHFYALLRKLAPQHDRLTGELKNISLNIRQWQ
ncbi:MAG: M48 family metallopeptidase [Prevotellaceae bacterium]|jgi:predicted metal-dependent hydrolase|nr:M48 family metallopeptidase [Prevotellaceae bacterium]